MYNFAPCTLISPHPPQRQIAIPILLRLFSSKGEKKFGSSEKIKFRQHFLPSDSITNCYIDIIY